VITKESEQPITEYDAKPLSNTINDPESVTLCVIKRKADTISQLALLSALRKIHLNSVITRPG
jgi:hypothetical protein